MTHASLCSGIGGFDLAASWAGLENQFNCEIDPFCRKVLLKHFPESTQYEDLTTTDFSLWNGRVDVLSAGFPCQPYSVAGKQLGAADNRAIWPQVLRVIREVKPAYVIGENVTGIINLALDEVLTSLEAEGYTCETFIVPACGVEAPHRRERVWIVAYTRCINGKWGVWSENGRKEKTEDEAILRRPNGQLLEVGTQTYRRIQNLEEWRRDQPTMGRMAHGVPSRMDRLKSLGNAIVPQCALPFFQAIQQHHQTNHTP